MNDTPITSFGALFDLLRYATTFRARIWLASICSIFKKLFDIMPEIMIGMAIDVVVRREESFMAECGGKSRSWLSSAWLTHFTRSSCWVC